MKKAKKILEANESENPTPIDEYSEQILKADQTLKEDCIKPVDISKNKAIKFGSYLIKMWFASPYPAEYSERPILYLCENCFKYLNSEYALMRHQVSKNIYYIIYMYIYIYIILYQKYLKYIILINYIYNHKFLIYIFIFKYIYYKFIFI